MDLLAEITFEREKRSVRRRDADGRGAAHTQRSYRIGSLFHIGQPHDSFLVGKKRLIDDLDSAFAVINGWKDHAPVLSSSENILNRRRTGSPTTLK